MVLLVSAMLFFASLWAIANIRLDAIPDLSDTQVIIQANYKGQPPQVVEDQVTYPLTTRMLSVPSAKTVRGYSFFGFSLVYVIFEDKTDLYWARSRVLEYLNSMQGKLPEGVSMELGPDATSIGWIYQYALKDTSGKLTLADLRDLQDFVLRYELTSLKGISEVASIGGFVRQFQIEVNPQRLFQYNVSINELEMALKKSNMEMGARLLEQAETEYMVLVKGYLGGVEDIAKIPIRVSHDGGVLRMADVAHIKEGPDIRRGLAELNGEGEVVGAIVVMRQGEDVVSTIERIKEKLASLKSSLPPGVEIVTTYDRSEIINKAVKNLAWKLTEELAVVALVTFIFLLHIRSALVALVTLPLGVMISFLLMHLAGISANIMSMGGIAIAIGVMVDSSVVMVENMHKHLEGYRRKMGLGPDEELESHIYWELAKEAVVEVAPALFWSMIIIVLSFLPVFVLPEQSGRLFTPLAVTKTFAMAVAAILSVVLMPVLVGYFVRGKIKSEESHPLSRFLISLYDPVLRWCLDHKKATLSAFGALFVLSFLPVFGIPNFSGKGMLVKPIADEPMPPLEEGDLLYMPSTIPGISISKAREILIRTDQMIKEVPEVKTVFGKIGRADTALDPAPLTMIETTILLKDKDEWREGMTLEKIKDELEEKVQLPGLRSSWTKPIKARIDMLSTGIRTTLGIKIMGEDLKKLQQLSSQLEGALSSIENVRSVIGERPESGNYIIYTINRERAGLYGLNVSDIQSVMSTALGGKNVTEIIEGPYRWSANIRYMRSFRESLEKLGEIYLPLPGNRGAIPISEVVELTIEKGPAVIKTENARKTAWLMIDVRERDVDMGRLVGDIRSTIEALIEEKKIDWPAGYSYIISGQYEQMQLADERLRILVPLVIVIVFLILYLHFRNSHDPAFIMGSAILFAPLGGIWLIYLLNYKYSVATGVGFIALIGLAAETGVIMLVYLNRALEEMKKRFSSFDVGSLREALISGAVLRVRPKMMTVITTMAGLLPLFWGDEPGNIAMRRIASPMVGGLVTSTVVTLILIPIFFEMWHGRKIQSFTIETPVKKQKKALKKKKE